MRLVDRHVAARLAALVVIADLGVAVADDREASFDLEAGPSLAFVEDARDHGDRGVLPGARLTLRTTYGLTDHVAAELNLGGVIGSGTVIDDQLTDAGAPARLHQNTHLVRVAVGFTARLGVRYIPTITLFGGYQHRFLTAGYFEDPASGGNLGPTPGRDLDDLIVGGAVGFEYRLGAHWVLGISVQAVHGFSMDGNSFDAIELPIRLAWYSYPEMWFR